MQPQCHGSIYACHQENATSAIVYNADNTYNSFRTLKLEIGVPEPGFVNSKSQNVTGRRRAAIRKFDREKKIKQGSRAKTVHINRSQGRKNRDKAKLEYDSCRNINRKQLRDIFNSTVLHETIMQILNMFMSMGRPHHWVDYLMPEDVRFYKSVESSGSDGPNVSDVTKLDQLMVETRTVLSSSEFGNIIDMSVRQVVDGLMEDINIQFGDGNLSGGIPLAKLLPRVAQISPQLLEEPSRNKFTHIIQNIPEVEVFFTLLYTNMS